MCDDCRRRAEDALKPKIPSLKFHIGSSSSPPSQKNKDKANQTKKRDSDNNGVLPQMKKFKHVEINHTQSAHRPSSFGPGQPQFGQMGMHDSIMNGPTLSPQGQVPVATSRPSNGQLANSPPPGLRSPPGPPAYTNGYTHHVSPQNGYLPRGYTYNSAPLLDGNSKVHEEPPNAAWSATYQAQRPADTPQQAQPVPPSANPFHNHSNLSQLHTSHPPLANSPALSPPQHTYSPDGSHPYLSNANGLPSQTYSLPPPLPPPVKRQSSPLSPDTYHIPSSSPTTGPNLKYQAPPSPGFSPTKHVSPHQTPIGNTDGPRVPSPMLQRQASQSPSLSPVKHSSPRPAPLPNNPASSPVAGPALPNKTMPNPGYSPIKQSPPRHPPSLLNGVIPPVERLNPSPPHA